MEKSKINYKKYYKVIYTILIILGTIFMISSCFHSNMWFDESYSVAMSKHSFKEIWQIGSNDVHPVLYYMMIKIVMLLTHNNIMCVRLFSCVPLIIMVILGNTFVKKEFGEKAGLIFTFLTLTFPTMLMYAGEIRMYTWAMLFVTLVFIYAYKILKNTESAEKEVEKTEINENLFNEKTYIKNWILFSLFALTSAYTHYYALVIAAIIDLFLIVYFIIKIKKNRKDIKLVKYYKQNLICSISSAVLQLLLYLPWLSIFLSQAKTVSKGFWLKYPNPIEVIEFIFTGNIGIGSISRYITIPFSLGSFAFLIYLIVKMWKKTDEKYKTVKLILYLWIAIIALMSLVSLCMMQCIFYQRYLFTLMGIFLIGFSILLSDEKDKFVICYLLISLVVATVLNINLIKTNYSHSNNLPIAYFEAEKRDDDWILISDEDSSGYVTVARSITDFSKVINYDVNNWNIAKAYKCYGNTITSLDELDGKTGRMWIISKPDSEIPNQVVEKLNAKVIDTKTFKTSYRNYEYMYTLIEVN